MSSDRSDAGIRLLGDAAARRRSLLTDDALRPRRVGPRPDGLLPRTLPAVVNSRRVLPSQPGSYAPVWPYRDSEYAPDVGDEVRPARESVEPEHRGVGVDHRPLIDELSDTELAREAVASLRQHQSPQSPDDLTPALLEMGTERSPNRADRRVPSGRHRDGSKVLETSANPPAKQRIRVVWAVAAAGVIALGTGFTAWAMSAPPETNQQQQTPPGQAPAPSAPAVPTAAMPQTSAASDPSVPGTTAPATSVAALPTDIVPTTTAAPEPVATAVPAVVITLGSGDAGFGWPSSAFGTSKP